MKIIVLAAAASLLAARASAMRIAECQEPAYVYAKASLVVEGKVASVLAKEDKNGGIFTYVRIKVSRVLKGKAGKNVTIKQFGGEMKDHAVVSSDTPSFKPGEQGYFHLDRPAGPFHQGKYYDAVCGWGATKEVPKS